MKVKELFESKQLEEAVGGKLLWHILDKKKLVSASREADKGTAMLMNKILKRLGNELTVDSDVASAIQQLKGIKGGGSQIAMKVQNAAAALGIK